jgi:hypothetical protein
MDRVRPTELHTAARVADALVYAAGVAGVIAGGLLFRDGQAAFALVAWVLTFIAGAGLRLAAWAAKALALLLVRTEQMERDLLQLTQAAPPPAPPESGDAPGGVPDPYRRWGGGWH